MNVGVIQPALGMDVCGEGGGQREVLRVQLGGQGAPARANLRARFRFGSGSGVAMEILVVDVDTMMAPVVTIMLLSITKILDFLLP